LLWLAVSLVVSCLISVVVSLRSYTSVRAFVPEASYEPFATAAMISWLPWTVLGPLVALAARRAPFGRGRSWRSLLVHVGGAALVMIILVAMRNLGRELFSEPGQRLRLPMEPASLSFLVYGLIVAAVHVVDANRRERQRALAMARLRAAMAETRLTALRARLHPHFLFNALQSITTLVHSDPQRAEEAILRLSDLLRCVLRSEATEMHTLDEELAAVDLYLEIESIRLGERLRVSRDVDPAARDAGVPPFLLQPIVENAVLHGLAPRTEGGALEITCRRVDGDLRFECRDDGVGLAAAPTENDDGTGLRLTRERLEQQFGARARLEVVGNEPRGTRVVVSFPYTKLAGNGDAR
jgi:sensor histidine kinase YesM